MARNADIGQVGAHGVGVVGGDAGRPQPLQEDRLEVDQVLERARGCRASARRRRPSRLPRGRGRCRQACRARPPPAAASRPRAAGRQSTGPAHEDGVGDVVVAEALDDRFLVLAKYLSVKLRDLARRSGAITSRARALGAGFGPAIGVMASPPLPAWPERRSSTRGARPPDAAALSLRPAAPAARP